MCQLPKKKIQLVSFLGNIESQLLPPVSLTEIIFCLYAQGPVLPSVLRGTLHWFFSWDVKLLKHYPKDSKTLTIPSLTLLTYPGRSLRACMPRPSEQYRHQSLFCSGLSVCEGGMLCTEVMSLLERAQRWCETRQKWGLGMELEIFDGGGEWIVEGAGRWRAPGWGI